MQDEMRDGAPDEPKPEPPREPESWECCQSGCDPCVFDRYWEALERYEQALARWELRRASRRGDM